MPQNRGFVIKLHSLNTALVFNYFFKNIDCIVKMFSRIHSPRNGKAQKLKARFSVFSGLRVAPLHKRPYFNAPNATFNI